MRNCVYAQSSIIIASHHSRYDIIWHMIPVDNHKSKLNSFVVHNRRHAIECNQLSQSANPIHRLPSNELRILHISRVLQIFRLECCCYCSCGRIVGFVCQSSIMIEHYIEKQQLLPSQLTVGQANRQADRLHNRPEPTTSV